MLCNDILKYVRLYNDIQKYTDAIEGVHMLGCCTMMSVNYLLMYWKWIRATEPMM